MNANDILGPNGILAQQIHGYEHRPQQIEMAALIEQALEERRSVVVEAGTGVGKSYAYLVPILAHGAKAVVSTANKTLQAQLLQKDLPALQRYLPLEFTYCVAKGKGNYLCLAKLTKDTPTDLLRWAEHTATGDVDDADFAWPRAWDPHRVGDVCHRRQCKRYGACFYYRAKAARRGADVIVCNHALLCQHLLHGDAGILANEATVLVVDEAHQLESYAVNAQSVELTARSFAGPVEGLAEQGAAFLDELAQSCTWGRDEDAAIPAERAFPQGEELAGAILGLDLEEALDGDQESMDALIEDEDPDGSLRQARITALQERLGNLAIRVRSLSSPTEPGQVRHMMRQNGRGLVAAMTTFDVSAFLGALQEQFKSAIYTSATISTGDDFSYFCAHHGMAERDNIMTLQLGSPFDYRRQCLLYLPQTMPEPDWQHRDLFDEAAREQMRQLVSASGGGAMCLFTSYYAMNAAADYLSRSLPYPVRRQGDLPRPALIEWMKTRQDGVLCATASFWEGVDIPGDSLRLVIIDKIPFTPPSPVEQARQAQAGRRAFMELSAPEATLRLKQGFGRLIRSSSDFGVVALLDPRLWLKGYGRKMIYALPDALVVREIAKVQRFFEEQEGPTAPRGEIVVEFDDALVR